MVGPDHATPNTVPAGEANSRTTAPEGAWISCTVYFCVCDTTSLPLMCTWSATTVAASPPNAAIADCETIIANVAMPASATAKARLRAFRYSFRRAQILPYLIVLIGVVDARYKQLAADHLLDKNVV